MTKTIFNYLLLSTLVNLYPVSAIAAELSSSAGKQLATCVKSIQPMQSGALDIHHDGELTISRGNTDINALYIIKNGIFYTAPLAKPDELWSGPARKITLNFGQQKYCLVYDINWLRGDKIESLSPLAANKSCPAGEIMNLTEAKDQKKAFLQLSKKVTDEFQIHKVRCNAHRTKSDEKAIATLQSQFSSWDSSACLSLVEDPSVSKEIQKMRQCLARDNALETNTSTTKSKNSKSQTK